MGCVLVTFSACGILPYLVFGQHTLPSTITTFYQVINSRQGNDVIAFHVVTITIQVLLLVHLTMAIILIMNPLFLHCEDTLGVAPGFSLKRVGIRSGFMLFILVVCLLLPAFQSVISLAGGLPVCLISIFLPIVIYLNLYELQLYKKVFVLVVLFVLGAFVAGNLIASVQNIIKTYKS